MIAYLSGELLERGDGWITLLAGDVGYRVHTQAPHGPLWVHAITNEFGTKLYGFATQSERAGFLMFLGIDGIGPVTAMALVAAAVDTTSVAALVTVKGVGKKTAEKIVKALQ